MYLRKVLCVGTIWDLDDVAYPELDDYSAMSRWNFYQIVKHQLLSSRKEMKKTEKKLPMVDRNQFGIRVKVCCASCQFKQFGRNGKRICTRHLNEEVESANCCKDWLMSEGMQKAGRSGGVARKVF